MAVEQALFEIGWMNAAADLSTKQFYCVKVTANSTFGIATSAGENILGILQDKPNAAGRSGNVRAIGVSKVKIGTGGLTAGGNWQTAADGTAITAASGDVGNGTVLIGGSAGELATVTVIASHGAQLN